RVRPREGHELDALLREEAPDDRRLGAREHARAIELAPEERLARRARGERKLRVLAGELVRLEELEHDGPRAPALGADRDPMSPQTQKKNGRLEPGAEDPDRVVRDRAERDEPGRPLLGREPSRHEARADARVRIIQAAQVLDRTE